MLSIYEKEFEKYAWTTIQKLYKFNAKNWLTTFKSIPQMEIEFKSLFLEKGKETH